MDERLSTQSFPNLHPHCHRSSFHPSLQSPEAGYVSSQSALESLEQYGNRAEESPASFPTSNTAAGGRRTSSGGDRGFLNASGKCLDGDASLGGHIDGASRLGSHFPDTWYGGSKKEVWEDGESCESSAEDFYNKTDCYSNTSDAFYTMNCGSEEGVRRKLRANYSDYSQGGCEAKNGTVYSREANVSHFTKQSTCYNRSAGSFSDSSGDYCRTDSKVSDNYLGREEDYGSSCGSGEDQLPPADVDGPWLSLAESPLIQTGDGRWKGAADTVTLGSGCVPQRSSVSISSGSYAQKLDSFSEAFLSQRKRRLPVIPSGDFSGQGMWEFEVGRRESPGLVKSRHSCAFDADSYLPPSSSSSPAHPSLPSFPSPPTSSHLMSSVLSPPPTPLPPPSHSPSKIDSPSAFGGNGQSQGGESIGTLQFFAARLQSLPSVHNSGMIWNFPLLPHCFPQPSGDPSSSESNLRASHGGDYGNITASHETLKSPELSFLTSSSHRSSPHPPTSLCPPNTPSLHQSVTRPSHLSGQHYEEAEKTAAFIVTQKVKNGPASLNQSQLQQQSSPIYTGTPFASILRSSRDQKRGHYTPRPLLNPVRRGMGLYSSISSLPHTEEETACGEEEERCGVLPCLNVGYEFQAEPPPCFVNAKRSGVRSPEDETPREQLLWKPWDELEESSNAQDQVERLLSMCSSSCLPGGGSNTELALHCLHYCQGNTMATLEMLLFSQPSPTGDYHYSGSDFWTDTERNVFSAALATYGKDFSLIQKMVRTKTARQCVEFYYMSKKILDKQKKLEEENRDGELEQQKSVVPVCQPVERQYGLEEAVPVPSLASFFPCKLCGKMFYKIKSRNAHMKIHRQPQEDWTERQLQHQLITHRLALSHVTNLTATPASNLRSPQPPALTFSASGLAGTSTNNSNADNDLNSVTHSNAITPRNVGVLDPSTAVTYNNIAAPNSHVITHIDASDSSQRETTTVLPFHQSWASFGHSPDPVAFYCNTDGKEHVGAGPVGGKEPINWQ